MTDQSSGAHQPSSATGPIVVLLVDDQAFIGAAIGRLLAAEPDIEFHYCGRALDAVRFANEIRPTVILQDLLMPDLDGLALVQAFRANPQTAGTPVVVLSGNDDSEARTTALTAGAIDYLVKLPRQEDLLACIRRHAPARAEQSLNSAVIAALRQADPEGSKGFVRALIDQFLSESAVQLARLGAAARNADAEELKASAHALRGAAATMGASKLASLCGQVERHAARRAGTAVITLLMADIANEFVSVQEALVAERQYGDHR